MAVHCSTCGHPLQPGEPTSTGPDGESHARCAKRATAHGQPLDEIYFSDELASLKRRVQALERSADQHAAQLCGILPVRVGRTEP